MYSGPGGGARHLHEGDLGLDAYRKVRSLLEVIPVRRSKKRSATAQTSGFATVAMAIGAALAGIGAVMSLKPANGGSFRRRRKAAVAA